MRTILAALLFAPSLAAAACFVHPDTGTTYCSAASECPQGTAWSHTQACVAAPVAAPTFCEGTASGSYSPTTSADINSKPVTFGGLGAPPAMWARVGGIVQVAGAVQYYALAAGVVQIHLSLPVATEFETFVDLAGTFAALFENSGGQVVGFVQGNTAVLHYPWARVGNEILRYSYTYRIKGC